VAKKKVAALGVTLEDGNAQKLPATAASVPDAVLIRSAFGHPLAPLVVGHKRQGKDDEDENGEDELHKGSSGSEF
jgi:hypothetical protein